MLKIFGSIFHKYSLRNINHSHEEFYCSVTVKYWGYLDISDISDLVINRSFFYYDSVFERKLIVSW